MASFLLPLLLLVVVSVDNVAGLKCYTCTGIKLTTSNSILQTALSAIGLAENTACDDGEESVTSLTCAPTSGFVEKCVTIVGEGSGSLVGQTFTAAGTYRACESVASDVADSCVSSTDLGPFSLAGIASFTAQKCYCSTDNCNGQTTLAPALILCLSSLFFAVFVVL